MKDKVLQTGIAAGMAAADGIHKAELIPMDPSFHGFKSLLPQSLVPDKHTRITLRGAKGHLQVLIMNIGAWSWGDKPTFHYSPEQLPAIIAAWQERHYLDRYRPAIWRR